MSTKAVAAGTIHAELVTMVHSCREERRSSAACA